MHRILFLLLLLCVGAAFAGDEHADTVPLTGAVAAVFDAVDESGPSLEGDDSALTISSLRHEWPSAQTAIAQPSTPDIPALDHKSPTLIRAPPACFS